LINNLKNKKYILFKFKIEKYILFTKNIWPMQRLNKNFRV